MSQTYLRKTKLAFIFSLLWTPLAFGEASDPLLGVWLTQKPDRNAKIHITPCEEDSKKFCGRIVWLEAPLNEKGQEKTDLHNPDKSLRDRKLMGLRILEGFQPKLGEPDVWDSGTIYNPQDGKTYDCIIRFQKDDQGRDTLFVRGYVGISWFGKTQTWIRSSLK